jgi:eukaryotic-like serine/threonine-protein kinase
MTALVSNLVVGVKIGSGHFGEVFLGKDDVHGAVAVKVLSRLAAEPDAKWIPRRDGLLREAQNLAKASHRNVVQVHHCLASEDGESIRFCMALCPAGSLQSTFDRGPMKLSAVRKVATEVTLGLQALHQRGMLHRDIKPANILLDPHGVAQLGDFGLVTDDLVFGYASAQGYLDHIAREVWHGEGTSAKTDIWALGMTLFRLLHGKNWYERQAAPRDRIKDGGFVDTLRWLPHVPAKWRRTLRQMMNDNPNDRYKSSEQLLAAFADLPVEPDWECSVEEGVVNWVRPMKARMQRVEWKRHSPRKHEWKAWSEPVGVGRKMSLADSSGVVSTTSCITGLEGFFRH